MSASVFEHVPVQIAAVVLGVILTAMIGVVTRLYAKVSSQSIKLAVIEAELSNFSAAREVNNEKLQDLWERVEKGIDSMEGRLESQLKEVAVDVKSLVKDMHSEFLRCPNHRAHGAGGF